MGRLGCLDAPHVYLEQVMTVTTPRPADGDVADRSIRWLLPSVLATLLGANLAITFLPGWSVVVAIVVVAALLLMARLAGHTASTLGLRIDKRSIIWAGAIGVIVWGGWLLVGWAATELGLQHELLRDDRNTGLTFEALMWSLLVVIPVGTVLMEEIGFRSVLMAEIHRLAHGKVKHPVLLAGALVSLGFGLWHVGPAVAQANASGISGVEMVGLIIVTVLFTAASGGLFAWLRHRTQSVITPAVLHAAVNGAGLLVVWALAQGIVL